MKILLMGDASNFHRSLAQGLRELGQEVDVCSDGTMWMDTERDISLPQRRKGKMGGLIYWLEVRHLLRSRLKDYDIVSIHNPWFLRQKPVRIRQAFDWLKGENRSIFLTALGTDTFFVDECMRPDSPLHYSEFRIYDRPGPHALAHPEMVKAWLSKPMRQFCQHVYDGINGAVAALYEYHVSLSRVLPAGKYCYGGLPIDTQQVSLTPTWHRGQKVKIFLGRHSYRQDIKGSDLLYEAAQEVVKRHPDKCEFTLVEDRPYSEFVQLLQDSHLVLDQVYSYTPATTALLAMAMGKTVVSGGEEDFYKFIGEETRPIINALPDVDALIDSMEHIVLNPEILASNARWSREFVCRHNETRVVAKRFLDFWLNNL